MASQGFQQTNRCFLPALFLFSSKRFTVTPLLRTLVFSPFDRAPCTLAPLLALPSSINFHRPFSPKAGQSFLAFQRYKLGADSALFSHEYTDPSQDAAGAPYTSFGGDDLESPGGGGGQANSDGAFDGSGGYQRQDYWDVEVQMVLWDWDVVAQTKQKKILIWMNIFVVFCHWKPLPQTDPGYGSLIIGVHAILMGCFKPLFDTTAESCHGNSDMWVMICNKWQKAQKKEAEIIQLTHQHWCVTLKLWKIYISSVSLQYTLHLKVLAFLLILLWLLLLLFRTSILEAILSIYKLAQIFDELNYKQQQKQLVRNKLRIGVALGGPLLAGGLKQQWFAHVPSCLPGETCCFPRQTGGTCLPAV